MELFLNKPFLVLHIGPSTANTCSNFDMPYKINNKVHNHATGCWSSWTIPHTWYGEFILFYTMELFLNKPFLVHVLHIGPSTANTCSNFDMPYKINNKVHNHATGCWSSWTILHTWYEEFILFYTMELFLNKPFLVHVLHIGPSTANTCSNFDMPYKINNKVHNHATGCWCSWTIPHTWSEEFFFFYTMELFMNKPFLVLHIGPSTANTCSNFDMPYKINNKVHNHATGCWSSWTIPHTWHVEFILFYTMELFLNKPFLVHVLHIGPSTANTCSNFDMPYKINNKVHNHATGCWCSWTIPHTWYEEFILFYTMELFMNKPSSLPLWARLCKTCILLFRSNKSTYRPLFILSNTQWLIALLSLMVLEYDGWINCNYIYLEHQTKYSKHL